ncbi:DUF1302 family protein [Pseudomonas sp. NBRC 100443]|uniref:DUF1302 domain-containing protein n=1 Tax=Pseudomonas sp. NBRC 100443 TaxID=1113665 RepID=UPI0024A0DCA7|nr:DUF1302 family protein [Pseudomonas sp. NBRC 100443]GLU37326.1 hypothetical protein Pssp01_14190 [Pseudomonas sp. NBRC 100443]
MKPLPRQTPAIRMSLFTIALASLPVHNATAFEIDTPRDWKVRWDNTLQYNLGWRAKNMDSRIANDPTRAESDHKFPDRGDVVTNRVALLSEFDVVFQDDYGARISGSGWHDYAYDDDAKSKSGYPSNYDERKYSSYTKRYYIGGGQLLDAFVFGNFDLAGRPASLKLGRLNQYWGNSLFFGVLGVSYSQSGSDQIKAVTSPGTQAKELALPRGQVNFSYQITDELSLGAQYFYQYEPNRMPEGGTFLGAVDFLFDGPDKFAAAGGLSRHHANRPDDNNGNFGLMVRWEPDWLQAAVSIYYRKLDETQAWGPILGREGATPFYRLSYATDVTLYGVSFDKQIGEYSIGAEMSYRENTALNGNNMQVVASDLDATKGPRGDTLNVVLNAVKTLGSTPLYDTGSLAAELGYVQRLRTTHYASRYKGVDTQACDASVASVGLSSGGHKTGCSTDEAVMLAVNFEPQWLQVLPNLDLSAPMFLMYGVAGNGASVGMPVYERDANFSIGLKGIFAKRYNATFQYNGYAGRSVGTARSPIDGSLYNASGNNLYGLEDRAWWSLAFSTTF